ncbi:MAG: hypothetical protein KF713_15865 [Turneriella sp.]|nr:hypothetical protein [Turneriella sp.]
MLIGPVFQEFAQPEMIERRPNAVKKLIIFAALSLSLHAGVFLLLFFATRYAIQNVITIHPVVIETNRRLSSKTRARNASGTPYNDLAPLLSPGGRKFDATGIFSLPDFYTANPSGNPNLTRPGAPEQSGSGVEPGRFSTGFDTKRYTTLQYHEFKVAKMLRLTEIPWLENPAQCLFMERYILDFLNDRLRLKTWYTLGAASRLPDDSEKKALVYYLRRLQLRVMVDGSAEQLKNISVTYRNIYEALNPDLKQYWDSLTGNYQALNDPERSPEF